MDPVPFPVVGQRFLNREAFTYNLQAYCWQRGLDFHTVLSLSSNTGYGVKYGCQNCCADVVGVKSDSGGRKQGRRNQPCIVELSELCSCISTKEPMDTLENLHGPPSVGQKFNLRSKIRALVEIWCYLNAKPMYRICDDRGQRFFWKCPTSGCNGLITVKKACGFFVIVGSVACTCRMACAETATDATSISGAISDCGNDVITANSIVAEALFDSPNVELDDGAPIDSNAKVENDETRSAANEKAGVAGGAVGAASLRGSHRFIFHDTFRVIGSDERGALSRSDPLAIVCNSTGQADPATAFAMQKNGDGDTTLPTAQNGKRARTTGDDADLNRNGMDDVSSTAETGAICAECHQAIAPPLVVPLCACSFSNLRTYHQGCFAAMIHDRPSSFVSRDEQPQRTYVTMAPKERRVCMFCRQPLDIFIEVSLRKATYPDGFIRDDVRDGPRYCTTPEPSLCTIRSISATKVSRFFDFVFGRCHIAGKGSEAEVGIGV